MTVRAFHCSRPLSSSASSCCRQNSIDEKHVTVCVENIQSDGNIFRVVFCGFVVCWASFMDCCGLLSIFTPDFVLRGVPFPPAVVFFLSMWLLIGYCFVHRSAVVVSTGCRKSVYGTTRHNVCM